MHKTRYTGDRNTELLTYCEAHLRYYVESGVKGKTETKVQKASYPIGSLMQGMKAHRRQVRHPDFKPEIGLDKWAGHGAIHLFLWLSELGQNLSQLYVLINKCRKYFL